MKIKDITEGFGSALAGSLAGSVGANKAVDYFKHGTSNKPLELASMPDSPTFFQVPKNVDRLLAALTDMGKSNNNSLTTTAIGAALNKRIPTAWKNEKNRGVVLANIAKQLQTRGINVSSTPASSAPAANAVWKQGDPIPMPDGSFITPADGKLYAQAAAQLQNK